MRVRVRQENMSPFTDWHQMAYRVTKKRVIINDHKRGSQGIPSLVCMKKTYPFCYMLVWTSATYLMIRFIPEQKFCNDSDETKHTLMKFTHMNIIFTRFEMSKRIY